MYLFGHSGLTAAAALRFDREVDLRTATGLAILPDLIDKPARALFPALVNHNTRNFGHSLLGAAAVLAVLLALRRRVGRPWLYWGCFVGHLALDRMWLNENPAVLLWPLLGGFPPPVTGQALSWALVKYNVAGEIVGLAILVYLARQGKLRTMGVRWPRSS